MEKIKLIEPTIEYEKDIWNFRQEILDSNDNDKFAGCGTLERCTSASEWVENCKLISNRILVLQIKFLQMFLLLLELVIIRLLEL